MNNLIQTLAWAIEDAGCTHYSNYPGFHSNELHAALNAQVTSTDEKNAFAYAWGCSMAGKRVAVSFKNVGLNDAADAFLGAHFVGCRAGLVLILFDDCDIQHSQSRIDVRPYFQIYGGLWLEPRTIQEAYTLTRDAFSYSEMFGIPVVIRITNILFDMGLTPSHIVRNSIVPPKYAPVEKNRECSPYVVHPSEAHRMEHDLYEKNKRIEDFVETLYPEEFSSEVKDIVFGAKRSVRSSNPIRLNTIPLPRKKLRKWLHQRGNDVVTIFEHGPTPFIKNLFGEVILQDSQCEYRNMAPTNRLKPRYHNSSYMEKLFAALRAIPNGIICGDLGGYTMDPHRTLQLCLCYGVSPAVAMGVSCALKETAPVFCVTGDAAYLHSGQQCLYEMVARKCNLSIFVLENNGALGTGGQNIPGDLKVHPDGTKLMEIDYQELSSESLTNFVKNLPSQGINIIIVHTHEHELTNNTH